ncbi:sigma-54-dependent transcriptional regulator [Candidatus Poribacteria bacterium]
MFSILVVDDVDSIRTTWIDLLKEHGYRTAGAATVDEAIRRINEDVYDLVLTDLKMGGMKSGIDVLKAAKQTDPTMEVIVITGHGTVESAVEAMKLGAFDYIRKPPATDELIMRVERAVGRKQMSEEIERLRERLRREQNFDTIVAESDEMKEVLHLVAKVAESDSPVLIQGESGTGKELIACAIHTSGRPNNQFLPINCGAFPETLLESELFGYMRGAFTGATVNKKGLFEEAHHGTLFMDEIGDMPPPLQVKLLRALDLGEIRRLGSNKPVYVNVRLVAATNKNVEELVQEGLFRKELYYRLNVIPIFIPPLRERKKDILPLAEHFLKIYSSKMNREVMKISPEARQAMVRYDWKGNVRELENAIERAVVLAQYDTISLADLPFGDQFQQPDIIRQATHERWDLKKLEKEHILSVLSECSGNHSQTAVRLGIARNTLWRKLKTYNVS